MNPNTFLPLLQVVGIILGITLCCQLTSKTRLYTYWSHMIFIH